MVVDVLGPIFCSAMAIAEFVPESWLEPLPDIFFVALGATGFWQNGSQTRCTSMQPTWTAHAREPRDMVDLRLACA